MGRFSFDALNNAPIEEVTLTAFKIVDAIQGDRPEHRASAAAMIFLLLCEEFGATPQEVFTVTKNMMASELSGANEHYVALRMYVENEARA